MAGCSNWKWCGYHLTGNTRICPYFRGLLLSLDERLFKIMAGCFRLKRKGSKVASRPTVGASRLRGNLGFPTSMMIERKLEHLFEDFYILSLKDFSLREYKRLFSTDWNF
jgi:hypothetical protein